VILASRHQFNLPLSFCITMYYTMYYYILLCITDTYVRDKDDNIATLQIRSLSKKYQVRALFVIRYFTYAHILSLYYICEGKEHERMTYVVAEERTRNTCTDNQQLDELGTTM
jgi:hypothetical protein